MPKPARNHPRPAAALPLVLCGLIAAFAPAPATLRAQPVVSRPVVQPLPAQDTQRLNRALVALARQPRSMEALIEAGEASLAVDDLDAALGFFGRAREIDAADARVYLGLARVYLRSGRPATALSLFDEAREVGAGLRALRSDRALALDMVGEHAAAQMAYRRLLEASPNDHDARRRLGLSYAISGQQSQFEATLRPLIERRDFAAFRARAFGLAILGEQLRAAAITEAVMPRELSDKVTPYLEFMPRLTGAQQAAAANLGIFPKAAEIGQDAPEIIAYRDARRDGGEGDAPVTPREAAADSALEPVGEPLGAPQAAPQAALSPAGQLAQVAGDTEPPVSSPESAPAATPPAGGGAAAEAEAEPEAGSEPESQPESPPDSQPETLADAFGDLLTPDAAYGDIAPPEAEGAVDISAIEVPREQPAPPEPSEPPPPAHPARIWVQLATGRDLAALGFDWRRFGRKVPDLLAGLEPHTVRWGQANRLLAGPVETREQAQDLVNALRQKGLDSFVYASPEGTPIQPLDAP